MDNNKLEENSPAGTLVGCMEGIDDDPGQSVSLLLVDSDSGLFETYRSEDGKLCLKVWTYLSNINIGITLHVYLTNIYVLK